jgi:hypothetical protein
MNATTTNQTRIAGLGCKAEQARTDGYLRYAQSSFLSELPGLAFGLLTVLYIVGSFLALA